MLGISVQYACTFSKDLRTKILLQLINTHRSIQEASLSEIRPNPPVLYGHRKDPRTTAKRLMVDQPSRVSILGVCCNAATPNSNELIWIKSEVPSVAVIMLSGNDTEQTLFQAASSGASDFLVKPCCRELIFDSIERVRQTPCSQFQPLTQRFSHF